MEDGQVNGEVLGEEEIGELKLDEDVLNTSGGGYDDELVIREDEDYPSNKRSGGGNSDILTPAGSVSSGEGLATMSSAARADSIPFEREMSIDDEITMETTDPITEEDPPSIASEIESFPRDAHEVEEEEENSQRLQHRFRGTTGTGVNTSMDMRSAGSASRSSYRPSSPTVKDMIDSYLYRDRETDPYDLLVDVPDIEVDTDSEEYEFDYEPVSDSDRGVKDLLTALEDQIRWKSDRNIRKAKGTFDEPRNTLISRYNPEYTAPLETYEPRTVPRSVPPASSIAVERSKRRSSLDATTREISNRYLAPLNKKLSSSYESLPRYVPSSTTSSSSSGYSSLGRYGSVDSLSPSRSYRSRSEEPASSYLSKPSYSSGLGYRSYSSSDVSRITPSYRASYADTYSYDNDDDNESQSESDDPYFSPLAPHRAYRANREGKSVKGPYARHMGRFSSTITSTSTPPRSPATSRKNEVPIDERLRQIRENFRKNHKLDYQRNQPYSSSSSYAGLGVDSEGGSALSMESSEDERVVSRAKIEPVRSRSNMQLPFFSLPLRRKTVYDGEPARISCNVQGTPKPKISWSKNGVPIYDGNFYNITYRWGVAMVEIRHASKGDTGTFRCTAKNAEGEATSACELVVEQRVPRNETEDYIRPSFAKPLRRIRAKEGRKVRLEIQVMGWPEPKVTWLKDNVDIVHSDHMYVEKFPNGLQSLVIYRVVPTDAGRYQAIASSPAGKATCSADVDVIQGEALPDRGGDVGRGRHKTRHAPRSPRSYLDVATESTRPHQKRSKHIRDPSSLSPTYTYESKRTQRKDYYTPRTDVLAPSRTRSYSPTSPTGLSPSSRYSPSRPYSPSTYRPSSPMGTYRPSSPTYRSPSPAYRPTSPTYRPSSPYHSYATSKRLTSRRGVEDSGVDYYQARSDRPSQYAEMKESRRTTRDSGPGYLDVTRTSATFTRSGGRPLPKLTSYTTWYDNMRANRDRPSTPTTTDRTRYTEPHRPGYTEPYRPVVRDRPVSGPTRIPRRVYRSEEEDYYSARQESAYKLDEKYSREYGGYEVDDDEFAMRTYAPSATGVRADDEEPEYAAPEEPEQAGPPTFNKKFQDMSIRDGERVVLEVEITGSRPMDIGWLRNGQDIVDCKEFRYVNRGNIYQLEIAEIFPEDSGKYTCEALNDIGEAECSAMLTVNEEPSVSISISQSMDVSLSTDMPCTATIDEDHIPPEFFEEPESQMVEEGSTAVFTCDVDGDPVPSLTWSKDGRPFTDGGRFSIRSDKFTHTLEIQNARSTDAGPYACTARNSEGEVVCEFTLDILPTGADDKGITASDVSSAAARDSAESAKSSSAPSAEPSASTAPQGSAGKGPKDGESTTGVSGSDTDSQEGSPPKFIRGLQEEVAWEEDEVVLECHVQGVPMPTVKWFVHNKEIESDKFVVITTDNDGVSRLTISEAFPEDSGVYRCEATNSSGTATTSGELMVAGKVVVPKVPGGKPKVEVASKTSFKITWVAPTEDGGSPIFNYKVDGRKGRETGWTEVANVDKTSFEATGIVPGVQYVYRISAENEAGWSPPTPISDPAVIAETESPPETSSSTDKPPVVKDKPTTNKDQAGKGPAPKPSVAPPPKRGGGSLANRMAKFSK